MSQPARGRQIWNGRWRGLPGAALLLLGIGWKRLRHRIATRMAGNNLAAFGHGSVLQAGTVIRHPGQVFVGARTSIAEGTVITTEIPDSQCRIGCDVIVASGVRLDFSGGLDIGDGVVISEHTAVFTHSHGLDPKSLPSKTPLAIGPGVWIGSRVLVLEGIGRIGTGAVVAAGSVVTREVPAGAVVAGVPARVVKERR